jgi:hypothetical protein
MKEGHAKRKEAPIRNFKERNMKSLMSKFVVAVATLTLGLVSVLAQHATTTVAPHAEAASGLDLYAVAELFKTSENLESFEQSLNHSETGINNLDLDQNGEVDFIRVAEKTVDDTHLIVLETAVSESEFQDVATIAIERESGEKYNLHIQGDTTLYGDNYYVVPADNNFSAWNVVRSIFRPNYRAYVSPYGYTSLPRWWGVRHPVALNVYRARTVAFAGRRNFVASRTLTVRTVNKINYHPRAATVVTRRTTTVTPRAAVQTRTETTTKAGPVKQTTTTRTQTRVVKTKKH